MLRRQVLMPRDVVVDGDVNDPEAPRFANGHRGRGRGTSLPVRSCRVRQPAPVRSRGTIVSRWRHFRFSSATESFNVGDVGFRPTLPGVDSRPAGRHARGRRSLRLRLVRKSAGCIWSARAARNPSSSRVGTIISLKRSRDRRRDLPARARAVAGRRSACQARDSAPFVPDGAIVTVRPPARAPGKSQEGTEFAPSRLGLARKAGAAGRELRVALPVDRGAAAAGTESPHGTRMSAGISAAVCRRSCT